MPLTDSNARVVEYPMSRKGVNIHKNIASLDVEECLASQNMFWRNGMVKRLGYAKFETDEVSTGKAITGLHRFYFSTSSKLLVVSSGAVIKEHNGSTWATIDSTIGQAQTPDNATHMATWGALGKMYIGNSTDRAISYDGTTAKEAGTATIVIDDYTAIDAGDTVTVTLDGVSTVLTAGGTDWTAATSNDATATSLASAIDGVTGVGAAAVTDTVTVTSTTAVHMDTIATTMDAGTEGTLTVNFLAPPLAIQFLNYQDRLLCIDETNPGNLTWSDSFSDTGWETIANVGVRPDSKLHGMIIHSEEGKSAGFQSKVLLAGSSGMYLFSGNDLRVPFTTGDYKIESLGLKVGCEAPRSMVWTPVGSLWLGIDKQVYLLPFDTLTPIPVGHPIQSVIDGTKAIESIPTDQIKNACAIYHDGFYKLAFTPKNGSTNTIQYWLDVDRLQRDPDTDHIGPWYGPMVGNAVSVFATQTGPGDSGELMAGEDSGATGSFVYEANKDATHSDPESTNIQVFWLSRYDPLGPSNTLLQTGEHLAVAKDLHMIELEHLDVTTSPTVDYTDITGALVTSSSSVRAALGVRWGDKSWNEFAWTGLTPVRQTIELSPALQPRRLALTVKQNCTQRFELYAIRVFIIEQSLVFA